MKSRFFITVFLLLNLTSYSQDIKQLLSQEEKARLNYSDTIIKHIGIKNRDLFNGYTGSLIIKRIDTIYGFAQIGEWTRNDYNNYVDGLKIFDSLGRYLFYKEFDFENKDFVVFDCKYSYKTVNGKTFGVNELVCMYNNVDSCFYGHRCFKVTLNYFGFYEISRSYKCGTWRFFNKKGKLRRTSMHRKIK